MACRLRRRQRPCQPAFVTIAARRSSTAGAARCRHRPCRPQLRAFTAPARATPPALAATRQPAALPVATAPSRDRPLLQLHPRVCRALRRARLALYHPLRLAAPRVRLRRGGGGGGSVSRGREGCLRGCLSAPLPIAPFSARAGGPRPAGCPHRRVWWQLRSNPRHRR